MDSLGVEPKRRSQEQGDSLDLRLSPKDTPSGLNILFMSPSRCVKGGNKLNAEFMVEEDVAIEED